jgi:hypothetical protein
MGIAIAKPFLPAGRQVPVFHYNLYEDFSRNFGTTGAKIKP